MRYEERYKMKRRETGWNGLSSGNMINVPCVSRSSGTKTLGDQFILTVVPMVEPLPCASIIACSKIANVTGL
jgi:hypothetical protein